MIEERILMVDDEWETTALVTYHLAKSGYRVATAGTGPAAFEAVEARKMLADSLSAFVRGDAALAREVCRRDDAVVGLNDSVFRILLTHMMEDQRTIGACLELLLVSRNLSGWPTSPRTSPKM